MTSKIATALNTEFPPVAIIWTDDKPEGAIEFKEGKWGCVMAQFANAAKGKTTSFSRKTFGCIGGGTGLGFGNQYLNWVGGVEGFCKFLSSGHSEADIERMAREMPGGRRASFSENIIHGEGYFHSPEQAQNLVDELPMRDVPAEYVIFHPLPEVKNEQPQVIVFTVNPEQLAALIVLAGYKRNRITNVIAPFAAGCQQVALLPYAEAEKEHPQAIIGLTDISARVYTRRILGRDKLTFAVPFKMFLEMEDNVEGSFLEREAWGKLIG